MCKTFLTCQDPSGVAGIITHGASLQRTVVCLENDNTHHLGPFRSTPGCVHLETYVVGLHLILSFSTRKQEGREGRWQTLDLALHSCMMLYKLAHLSSSYWVSERAVKPRCLSDTKPIKHCESRSFMSLEYLVSSSLKTVSEPWHRSSKSEFRTKQASLCSLSQLE